MQNALPENGCAVVVALHGEYTVKGLRRGPDCIWLEFAPTAYPCGRFAHLQDPEGNPIELWQPMEAANTK